MQRILANIQPLSVCDGELCSLYSPRLFIVVRGSHLFLAQTSKARFAHPIRAERTGIDVCWPLWMSFVEMQNFHLSGPVSKRTLGWRYTWNVAQISELDSTWLYFWNETDHDTYLQGEEICSGVNFVAVFHLRCPACHDFFSWRVINFDLLFSVPQCTHVQECNTEVPHWNR